MKKELDEISRGMLYDYTNMLVGNEGVDDKHEPLGFYFRGRSTIIQERYAMLLIQYLCEEILKISPQQAQDMLTPQLLEKWQLKDIYKKIKFPNDLRTEYDMFYVAYKIWPKQVKLAEQDIYLKMYQRILDGDKLKFPKDHFSNQNGMIKVCAYLKYAIENFGNFTTVSEMYNFFGNTKKAREFLKEYKLFLPYKLFFDTPVEFLHYTLHPAQRIPFLYEFYVVLQKANLS